MSLVRSSCSSSRCPRLDLLYGVEGLQRAELLLSAPLGSHSPGQLQPCAPPFDPPTPLTPSLRSSSWLPGWVKAKANAFSSCSCPPSCPSDLNQGCSPIGSTGGGVTGHSFQAATSPPHPWDRDPPPSPSPAARCGRPRLAEPRGTAPNVSSSPPTRPCPEHHPALLRLPTAGTERGDPAGTARAPSQRQCGAAAPPPPAPLRRPPGSLVGLKPVPGVGRRGGGRVIAQLRAANTLHKSSFVSGLSEFADYL